VLGIMSDGNGILGILTECDLEDHARVREFVTRGLACLV
jgi:hypothetical protein